MDTLSDVVQKGGPFFIVNIFFLAIILAVGTIPAHALALRSKPIASPASPLSRSQPSAADSTAAPGTGKATASSVRLSRSVRYTPSLAPTQRRPCESTNSAHTGVRRGHCGCRRPAHDIALGCSRATWGMSVEPGRIPGRLQSL